MELRAQLNQAQLNVSSLKSLWDASSSWRNDNWFHAGPDTAATDLAVKRLNRHD